LYDYEFKVRLNENSDEYATRPKSNFYLFLLHFALHMLKRERVSEKEEKYEHFFFFTKLYQLNLLFMLSIFFLQIECVYTLFEKRVCVCVFVLCSVLFAVFRRFRRYFQS
jgi:hypothetical protein